MKPQPVLTDRGFSLIDMLVVVALIGVISAIAVPTLINAIEQMKLGQAVRNVERELQTAKMRAVGKGRPMRVLFNCPNAGQFRMVELIGNATAPSALDSAANRCAETAYPFPAPDANPVTRPNLDGPVRSLESTVAFANAPIIEFRSDGTAYSAASTAGPFSLIPVAGVNVSLTRQGKTSTITVNGLGKVQLQTQ